MKKIVSRIETLTMSFEDVEQHFLSNHISYRFENQVLLYVKSDDKKITLGCLKGYLLEDLFTFDYASKYMRHMYIRNENDFNEEIIKHYISEAIVCSIELNEKKIMKQHFRRKKNNGYSTSD